MILGWNSWHGRKIVIFDEKWTLKEIKPRCFCQYIFCQDIFVKIFSSRYFHQDIFVKILLSRYFCQDIFVKIFWRATPLFWLFQYKILQFLTNYNVKRVWICKSNENKTCPIYLVCVVRDSCWELYSSAFLVTVVLDFSASCDFQYIWQILVISG